jgi:hypothetical protein
MAEIKKIEKCDRCRGKGYTFEAFRYGVDDYGPDEKEDCYKCKGSGKLTNFYQENGTCYTCSGSGKVQFVRPSGQFPNKAPNSYFGFGTSSDSKKIQDEQQEQRAWENKHCYIGECENCEGRGTNLTCIRTEASSGGCFLTTACVEYYGFEDNCYELQLLRKYRNCYLNSTNQGYDKVRFYYKYSPLILDEIFKSKNKENIFKDLFSMVKLVVGLIEKNKNIEALSVYENKVYELLKQFNISVDEADVNK